MKRQLIAIAVGTVSIALAAVVGAQSGETGTGTTEAQAVQMAEQAKVAVSTMERLLKEAEAAYSSAQESQDLRKIADMKDPLSLLTSVVKMATSALVDLGSYLTKKRWGDVASEYVKIQTFLSKAEGYYGELKGSSSDTEGGSVDGRPLIEKTISEEVPNTNATEGTSSLDNSSGYVSSVSPFFDESNSGN